MNLNATKRRAVTCHYHDRRQVLFWYATGSSNDPNALLLYDTLHGAWSRVPTTDIDGWCALCGDVSASVRSGGRVQS